MVTQWRAGAPGRVKLVGRGFLATAATSARDCWMTFDTAAYRGKDIIGLPEHRLVRFIVHEASTLYEFFNFVVEPALGPPSRRIDWDYLFFAELPRPYLGLRPGLPGDIDILIVPTLHGLPRVEYSAAIEVKRLALRGPNWSKNVDRYGVTQAEGLLRCGFPFVGILHLIVNAPGPAENWRNLHQYRIIDEFGRAEFESEGPVDMTGYFASERQFARLTSRAPDPAIGLNCIALTQTTNAEGKSWFAVTNPETRPALRNPRTHPLLLKNIELFTSCAQNHAPLRNADARRRRGE